MEAAAKTRKASWPSPVAELAKPRSRSSKTFGKANVVDWKMMLETAVVRKTMIEMRRSAAL